MILLPLLEVPAKKIKTVSAIYVKIINVLVRKRIIALLQVNVLSVNIAMAVNALKDLMLMGIALRMRNANSIWDVFIINALNFSQRIMDSIWKKSEEKKNLSFVKVEEFTTGYVGKFE